MSWLPLDSAPRDGSEFRVMLDNGKVTVGFYDSERLLIASAFFVPITKPIGWQPLEDQKA